MISSSIKLYYQVGRGCMHATFVLLCSCIAASSNRLCNVLRVQSCRALPFVRLTWRSFRILRARFFIQCPEHDATIAAIFHNPRYREVDIETLPDAATGLIARLETHDNFTFGNEQASRRQHRLIVLDTEVFPPFECRFWRRVVHHQVDPTYVAWAGHVAHVVQALTV